ncbi:MAG TPA: MotA/TolQ/ExbB proton channel family protein [bacterium]|nr:MotA/TolQ/ExbB proton channel family protein [bacterium]
MKLKKVFIPVVVLSVYSFAHGADYRVRITDIQRTVHRNLLSVPKSMDMTVSWEFDRPEHDTAHVVFRVTALEGKADADVRKTTLTSCEFLNKKAGLRYGIVVETLSGNRLLSHSDTAWVTTGRMRAEVEPEQSKWHYWIPLSGRFPLGIIRRGAIFDSSTTAGKVAFHAIWNFFLAGVMIWLFFCWKHLSLAHVFPLMSRINFGRSFDSIYRRGISKEFEDIMDQWREMTESANDHIRDGLSRNRQNCVDDISGENVAFWRDKGVAGIRVLKERMQKFMGYPVARIVEAGLENHELGGFRWLEVSKEVDRAIENQAASELEKLRRQSVIDWLWNLGTLSPIIGLFGTATGISNAFHQLTQLRTDITQNTLVRSLAGGIFEALWTTIMGLFVGIFMMLLYFYYQNKLNWIYSKWEEIYVNVTRKL